MGLEYKREFSRQIAANFLIQVQADFCYFGQMEAGLLYKEECYEMVGLCMKIHTKLGKGFKEIVYKDALEIEINNNGRIPYEREKSFDIMYDGIILPHRFNADYFVFNSIILEIKATSQVHADAFRQTLNYLKASQVKLGILINFGADKLEFQRIICSYANKR